MSFKEPARFPLGKIYVTRNAAEIIPHFELWLAVTRHARGDWGEVCPEDSKENEFSLREGFRLMSVYRTENGVKFWVITEADRSMTTVLLPEDY